MFSKRRKIAAAVSVIIAASMTAGSIPFNSYAADNKVVKEEVVYGIMNPTGLVDNIYVVNSFDIPMDTVIEDYGEYKNVKNLTDLSNLKYDGNKVQADRTKGKFYYQGDLTSKELPWNINISYYLNGKEIKPEAIRGKDGKIKIIIDIKENENIDPLYFDKYMVQLSVNLDTDKCKNIKAKGATIANAGTDKMINFATMPEKESSYTITADVEDFSMKDITLAGVPFSMSEDMIDMSKIDEMAEGLDELSGGVSSLNNGAGQLDDGLKEFYKGSEELNSGFSEFNSGIDQLLEGANQLKDGSGELRKGSKSLKNGLDLLSENSSEIENGSAMINDALIKLKDKKNELVGEIDEEQLNEIRDLMEKAYKVLVFLQGELENIIDLIEEHNIEVPEQSYSKEEIQAALEEIKALLDNGSVSQKTYGVMEELCINSDVADKIDKIINSRKSMLETLEKIKGDLDHIIEVIESIKIPTPDEIEKLLNIIDEFADQYSTFHNEGIVQFMDGVRGAADGYSQLDTGIDGLYNGTSGLYDGIKAAKNGSDQLLEGVGGLKDGAYTMSGGMSALAGGINILNQNTSKIPEVVEKGIDDMLGKFMDSDIDMVSFVSPDNDNVQAVQFVMVVKGIEPVEKDDNPTVEEKESSIWEKIKDLFR